MRVVSRRKRAKVSQLQQVIAMSRQCSLAMENGATELACAIMADRDELCKTLTPEDRCSAEQRQEFGQAFMTIHGLLEEI